MLSSDRQTPAQSWPDEQKRMGNALIQEFAIGLQGIGSGRQFSEARQRRFADKMRELTSGNRAAPIVTFCTNAERFTGYNLTHRLVALGYTNVLWYRGGTEAWSLNGLPETELAIHDW